VYFKCRIFNFSSCNSCRVRGILYSDRVYNLGFFIPFPPAFPYLSYFSTAKKWRLNETAHQIDKSDSLLFVMPDNTYIYVVKSAYT